MANEASYVTLNNWGKRMAVSMQDVLAVSMDVMGRNGDEACKHAIILMAQSAKNLAKKSKRTRPELIDMGLHRSRYVEVWKQGETKPKRLYKWRFSELAGSNRLDGTWQDAKKIANTGLASRSWMWGLAKLGKVSESRPIPGTSKVYSILTDKVAGYVKQNKLSYITKAMPAGWEAEVQRRAGDRIMANAVKKMQREWASSMNRKWGAFGRVRAKPIKEYFLRSVA